MRVARKKRTKLDIYNVLFGHPGRFYSDDDDRNDSNTYEEKTSI